MADVNKVIQIAESEVGYLEKRSNKDLDSKTKNAGSANYTKYGKEMHAIYPSVMDFPAAWCDCFVDWCFYEAYGVSNAKGLLGGDFDDYTVASAQLYKNKKAYIKRGQGLPKRGDQIFFHNGTRIYHTGLVIDVDNGKVYTIEGNTSGANGVIANGGGVCKKSYALTYARIDGYGRPKYGDANSNAQSNDKSNYYPKYTGKSEKIDEILKAIGAPYGNVTKRKPVAVANGISDYKGTYDQNIKINSLAKAGKLKNKTVLPTKPLHTV